MINLREPKKKDEDKIIKLWKPYDDNYILDLNNVFSSIIAEKDEELVGFGWLNLLVECNVILTQDNNRNKFEALKQIIAHGSDITNKAGFDHMIAFIKDDKFANVLSKHLSFQKVKENVIKLKVG